jgi:hypothetical protein
VATVALTGLKEVLITTTHAPAAAVATALSGLQIRRSLLCNSRGLTTVHAAAVVTAALASLEILITTTHAPAAAVALAVVATALSGLKVSGATRDGYNRLGCGRRSRNGVRTTRHRDNGLCYGRNIVTTAHAAVTATTLATINIAGAERLAHTRVQALARLAATSTLDGANVGDLGLIQNVGDDTIDLGHLFIYAKRPRLHRLTKPYMDRQFHGTQTNGFRP